MSAIESRQTNAAISIAAVVVVIYGMQAAKVLLVPFLLAVFFAMISVRPMLWLQKHRVPSFIAVLLIVIVMMGLSLTFNVMGPVFPLFFFLKCIL